jgi:hypothetical protein
MYSDYEVLQLLEYQKRRLEGVDAERIDFLMERDRNKPSLRRRVANGLIELGLAVDPTVIMRPGRSYRPGSSRRFIAAR